MKYLKIKFRRDFIKLFPQFFSVFMMALLSVAIFAGFDSVWTGMEYESQKFYDDAKLADVWIYGKELDEEALEKLEDISGVRRASGSMSIVANIISEEGAGDIKLITVNDDRNQRPLVLEGEAFDKDIEGLWLDRNYAEQHRIRPGDHISFSYGGFPETETEIKGLVMSPEFIYYTGSATETMPDPARHAYGYLGEDLMEKTTGCIFYNEARLTVSENADTDEIGEEAERILGDKFFCKLDRENFPSTSQMSDEIAQTKKMAMLFTLIFVLLAILTMYTSISRLVKKQMVQIGIIKALGFKDSHIMRHYMLYGIISPLCGALAGFPVGRAVIGNIVVNVKKTTLSMPSWSLRSSYGTLLAVLFIVLICTLATVLAVLGSLRLTPAETLRGADRGLRRSEAKGSSGKSAANYTVRWVQRDIARNKLRYAIGFIGVAGSMVLMIAGVGMTDSISSSNSYVFTKQYSYDYIGRLKQYSEGIRSSLVRETESELQWLDQKACEAEKPDGNETLSAVISIIEDGAYFNFEDEKDSENIRLPGEGIILSSKFARRIGADKGDRISFTVTGISGKLEAEVGDIISARTPQGIYLSDKAWEALGQEFQPRTVAMNSAAYKDLRDNDIFAEISAKSLQEENVKELTESVNTVIKILILASFLLSAVILYNLGVMSYEERYKEYATMAVIGYTKREIRTVILTDCLFTAIPGILTGIPAGLYFLRLYIDIVSFDSYEWRMTISAGHLIMLSLFVLACALSVSMVICRKANRIVMTEALKSFE